MRAESVWRRDGFALVPWSAEARDALLALSPGGQCVGHIWVPQRPQQLAEYWTLCGVVGRGVGQPREAISDRLLVRVGLFDRYVDSMKRLRIEPRSVSKQNMDAVDFKSFMDHAIVEMAEMVGAAPKDVRREFIAATREVYR